MCFTSRPTSDERSRGLTDGLRAKLWRISGSRQRQTKNSKLPASRPTKAYPDGKSSHPVAKLVGLSPSRIGFKNSPARTALSRVAEIKLMHKPEAMTNSLTPNGVGAGQRFVRNGDVVPNDDQSERVVGNNAYTRDSRGVLSGGFASNSEMVSKDVQSDRLANSVTHTKIDKKVIISAQLISKMNTKQVRGMMKGIGKELQRAATTVSEKIPITQTKKKSKEEKDRLELLEMVVQKPELRNADEIKKAYGHASATDQTNHAAIITRAKLHERGQKISALQRRTTELEADAANFSSLAEALVKKMENRKWYEFS